MCVQMIDWERGGKGERVSQSVYSGIAWVWLSMALATPNNTIVFELKKVALI